MNCFDILKKLCSVPYVTGKEENFTKAVEDCLYDKTPLCRDNMGNIILKTGKENAKNKILIDAHCDRIGFVVTELLGAGFVRLSAVGSIDERTLLGARLKSTDGAVFGVFATVPPHLQKSGDGKTFPDLSSLALDTGLCDEELNKQISMGDLFTFQNDPCLLNDSIFASAALDNLAGCAAAISVYNEFCKKPLENTCVTVLLSIGEEVGLRGAKAYSLVSDADEVVCIDVSFASYPGTPDDKTGRLGGSIMLGVGPILSKNLKNEFEAAAERLSMPIQHEILPETTGTNADVLTLCRGGVPCALVSIPIRNMHTQNEVVNINDIQNCYELICEQIRGVDKL